MTFNYTDTLEKVYGIKNRVLYLHGKLDKTLGKQFWGPTIPGFKTIEEAEIHPGYDINGISNYTARTTFQFGSSETNVSKLVDLISNYFNSKKEKEWFEDNIEKLIKHPEENINKLESFLSNEKIDEVIIMGHSLSRMERIYFENVFLPNYKNIPWTFYFHDNASSNTANCFAEEYGISNYSLKKW